ncbi:leucine-rich repeat-containing protein 71 isoform X2 [Corythoichthys intestinalis]|uniref:leucine-rich repeat-containing protein 71 isoform X2 n=1 Tax=Corythoichthys intestinalis TaxID=161448 RepID=UPI0025A63C04|nr:leucine-rich repeat-containing protein 71 isoform X2 [Corythoichthys intestinalis]
MARKKPAKDKSEKTADGEESASGQTAPDEPTATRTFDDYECSGNVMTDFPGLCALLDMKDIPAVKTKPGSANQESTTGGRQSHKKSVPEVFKPFIQVQLENGDPYCTSSLKIFGWTVDEPIIRVLCKMISSMSMLNSICFWQAGLTDSMVINLGNAICFCNSLRVITLEGNPLLDHNHHLLFSEGNALTHLNLRNNQIEDEGARLLGAGLSTSKSANRNLISLNLSFNHIGDVGAGHIAKGLRFNRTLLFLSLSNNHIGDSGATQLATVFGEVVLTHEEIVQRRKLLLEKMHSITDPAGVVQQYKDAPSSGINGKGIMRETRPICKRTQKGILRRLKCYCSSSPVDAEHVAKLSNDQLPSVASNATSNSNRGENKSTAKKRETSKPDGKRAPTKDQKCLKKAEGQDMEEKTHVFDQEVPRTYSITKMNKKPLEMVSPLLNESTRQRDGELVQPGNTTLVSLSLAGNRITEVSLPQFLTSLQMQEGGKGLLRLCLQRNHFALECEPYIKLKELMTLRDPLNKKTEEEPEEEAEGSQSSDS